jgi:hypothetical protein
MCIMAKIDHSFSMPAAPEQAQESFLNDVGPQLHKVAGFSLYEQKPGHLAFSDGIVEPTIYSGVQDEADYAGLRRLTARRIKIDFAATPTGTTVTITGHAQREIRDALDRLGEPGHWPNAAT